MGKDEVKSSRGMASWYHIDTMSRLNSRHHWISQFLLRRFSIPAQAGEEIYVYARDGARPRMERIRDVAQERGFNTLSSTDGSVVSAGLEDIFSNVESAAAPIINKLCSGNVALSSKERTDLARYVGILAAANPKSRRLQQVLLDRSDEIVAYLRDNKSRLVEGFAQARPDIQNARERMERYIDNPEKSVKELPQNPKLLFAYSSFMIGLSRAQQLLGRKWDLVIAPDRSFFVISDHPVVALPGSDNPRDWADRYASLPLVLPISPDKALHMIEEKGTGDVVRIEAAGVDIVNTYSMIFAEDEVYSHADSDGVRNEFANTNQEDSDKFFID